MRILSIETSTRRGSAALIEDGRVVAAHEYVAEHGHVEHCLPLVQRIMSITNWSLGSLQRLAVGIGPGSFTGVRAGIALGQGIGVALGIPVLGVSSLAAMASALSPGDSSLRAAVLDARRGELFLAIYGPTWETILEPTLVSRTRLTDLLAVILDDHPTHIAGEVARELELPASVSIASEGDLPHARQVGLLAAADGLAGPASALYVRDADAALPQLPVSPLARARH